MYSTVPEETAHGNNVLIMQVHRAQILTFVKIQQPKDVASWLLVRISHEMKLHCNSSNHVTSTSFQMARKLLHVFNVEGTRPIDVTQEAFRNFECQQFALRLETRLSPQALRPSHSPSVQVCQRT